MSRSRRRPFTPRQANEVRLALWSLQQSIGRRRTYLRDRDKDDPSVESRILADRICTDAGRLIDRLEQHMIQPTPTRWQHLRAVFHR
jgi:hypothetical protein